MIFKDIVMARHAVKKFDGKSIPQDKVEELLDLIRHTPSSYNIQPWRIRVVTDIDMKKRLKKASFGQSQIDTCSHLLVFLADTRLVHLADELEKLMKKEGVPFVKRKAYITMVKRSMENLDKDAALHYAQNQVYIALATALYGSVSCGFDSCPMGGFDAEKYVEILELPEHLVPTVLCPIGYGAHEAKKKIRFEDVTA